MIIKLYTLHTSQMRTKHGTNIKKIDYYFVQIWFLEVAYFAKLFPDLLVLNVPDCLLKNLKGRCENFVTKYTLLSFKYQAKN